MRRDRIWILALVLLVVFGILGLAPGMPKLVIFGVWIVLEAALLVWLFVSDDKADA